MIARLFGRVTTRDHDVRLRDEEVKREQSEIGKREGAEQSKETSKVVPPPQTLTSEIPAGGRRKENTRPIGLTATFPVLVLSDEKKRKG